MIEHTVKIPVWLDFILALPALAWRFVKFGYTYRKIYLGEGEWTILDQRDYRRLCHYKWYLNGTGTKLYAMRSCKTGPKRTKLISMHREIMNFPADLLVDHIDGNSLDNRRKNLRTATKSQNNTNSQRDKSKTSSRFRGVSFYARTRRWAAKIRHKGKTIWLGYYDFEIDAAKAYDAAAKKYHGEFARLNFPQ